MAGTNNERDAADAYNQAGCPFRDQTVRDAVRDWASVLAGIDALRLPPDLRIELEQLRSSYETESPCAL
jgi:hypothetical protein